MITFVTDVIVEYKNPGQYNDECFKLLLMGKTYASLELGTIYSYRLNLLFVTPAS